MLRGETEKAERKREKMRMGRQRIRERKKKNEPGGLNQNSFGNLLQGQNFSAGNLIKSPSTLKYHQLKGTENLPRVSLSVPPSAQGWVAGDIFPRNLSPAVTRWLSKGISPFPSGMAYCVLSRMGRVRSSF